LTCESSYLFINYLKEYLFKVTNSFILIENKKYSIPLDFLKNHITTTFIETLKWWIKNNMNQPPKEVAKYFMAVILPILGQ